MIEPNADPLRCDGGGDGGGVGAGPGLLAEDAVNVPAGFGGSVFFVSAATLAAAPATFSAAARWSVDGLAGAAPAAGLGASGLISVALPSMVACGRFGPDGPDPCVPFVIAASSFRYAIPNPVGPRETCAKSMRLRIALKSQG
jgi:hypothetical protein